MRDYKIKPKNSNGDENLDRWTHFGGKAPFSYIKERGDKDGGADLRAAQGMWTLEDVADIFGYRFEYEDTDMRGRVEYPIYRLIKKAR